MKFFHCFSTDKTTSMESFARLLIAIPLSIKQDENGKFDFKIDGVSHVNWFRKKMNEFREAIGIPKPRQNRSMKL